MAPVWRVLKSNSRAASPIIVGAWRATLAASEQAFRTAVPGVGLVLLIRRVFMAIFGRQLGTPQLQIARGGAGGTQSARLIQLVR